MRARPSQEVARALASEPGVREVHHLHLWNLASDVPALSAHVVLGGDPSMHEAQIRGEKLKAMVAERFGIEHATLELECHVHEAEDHRPRPSGPRRAQGFEPG
ncbi:MAG: hypothetical protein M3Q23_18735 [Actinomycetota bacterium]|nr:hypothetical protein [Actinomycetota bacterium]